MANRPKVKQNYLNILTNIYYSRYIVFIYVTKGRYLKAVSLISLIRERISLTIFVEILESFRGRIGAYQTRIHRMLQIKAELMKNYDELGAMLHVPEQALKLLEALVENKLPLTHVQFSFLAICVHRYYQFADEVSKEELIDVLRAFQSILDGIKSIHRRIDHPGYFINNLIPSYKQNPQHRVNQDENELRNAVQRTIEFIKSEEKIYPSQGEYFSRNLEVISEKEALMLGKGYLNEILQPYMRSLLLLANLSVQQDKRNESKDAKNIESMTLSSEEENRDTMKVLNFDGFHGIESVCGFYIGARKVEVKGKAENRECVVIQQLSENYGTSITNMIEHIAFTIYQANYRGTDPKKIDWYEYYPGISSEPSWNVVTFNVMSRQEGFSGPHWKGIDTDEIDYLKSNVLCLGMENELVANA